MALIQHVALVTETRRVKARDLAKVGAALQKQVTRDFGPIWGVRATVDAFGNLEDVPIGYWPVIVVEKVPDAAGVHLDKNGQPYALVEYGSSWSLTASHECLEMLADPYGNRVIAGGSPKPGQGRVEFLVEVCDPAEDARYAYTVNGVLVSDFYTPQFFDPTGAAGVRYSFGGHIPKPRQILAGGYLSWHDPVGDHWWQETWFGGAKPAFRDLGKFSASDPRSLREIVDSLTPQMQAIGRLPVTSRSLLAARSAGAQAGHSTNSKAKAWRAQIAAFRAAAKRGAKKNGW